MTNHKIIVIPGAKKGINIPIALQSCVCRYYLENEHKKQVMPECEISFNDHMPRIKHHALTIRGENGFSNSDKIIDGRDTRRNPQNDRVK